MATGYINRHVLFYDFQFIMYSLVEECKSVYLFTDEYIETFRSERFNNIRRKSTLGFFKSYSSEWTVEISVLNRRDKAWRVGFHV